ncbi:MAG: hypothetical protein ACOWYE_05690 [Desulfatiglandales bacterium]
MKSNRLLFVCLLCVMTILIGKAYAVDWVPLNGTVKNLKGDRLCTMVLANGQYMFSCDPIGDYSLYLPLDQDGRITLFCFCDSMMPFKTVLEGEQTSYDIVMKAVEEEPYPWILYDDFESGEIDETKWSTDASSADITIENGQAKFAYKGPSDDSSWLVVSQCPDDVIGIRTKVTITSWHTQEDFRARIGMRPGYIGDNYYWLALDLRPIFRNIAGGLGIARTSDNAYVSDMSWCQFETPTDVIGQTYTISIYYFDGKITLEVAGQGKQVFDMPEEFASLSDSFKAIGIRGSNIEYGPAHFTAYFDDVYIMRTGECE